ncbi:hypothetical protein ACH40E_38855 [Streptomyces acidicola]|uniref:hypothetical protein n=1 Tax=Streptomyces acidicola TaxID=2596892 RepID=UPI00379756B3
MRDPDGRGVWMKASGWGFEEVTPRRTLLVSPEGQALAREGPGVPHPHGDHGRTPGRRRRRPHPWTRRRDVRLPGRPPPAALP